MLSSHMQSSRCPWNTTSYLKSGEKTHKKTFAGGPLACEPFSFWSLVVLKKIILIKTLSVRLNVTSMEISLHSKSGMDSSRISQKLWGSVIKWSFIWDYCSSYLAFFKICALLTILVKLLSDFKSCRTYVSW